MILPGDSGLAQKTEYNNEKAFIRKQSVRARESLSPAEREAKSCHAVNRIAALPDFRNARTVMLYRAIRGELSLETLCEHPAAAGKCFVYPRCIDRSDMEALIPGIWKPGAFGIPEPAEDSSEAVPPEEIDLVICPGTAFDDRGIRLGMGAGYYDRFLPKCVNAVAAMAAFEMQHVPFLPAAPGDVPMDLVVTDENLYLFPGRKNRNHNIPKKKVRVAAAVLCCGNRVFAARRGYGPWKDYWEFPGGKIEPDESPQEALIREIREELDTAIAVGSKLAQVEYDYPEFHLSMSCFRCRVLSGSLTLKEHESARWLRTDELNTVDWLPADLSLIRQFRNGGLSCG